MPPDIEDGNPVRLVRTGKIVPYTDPPAEIWQCLKCKVRMSKQKNILGVKMASDLATAIAAQVWCQPSLGDKVMDIDIAQAFAEILDRYIEALQWCSSFQDFAIDGNARLGWERIVKPLISDPNCVRGIAESISQKAEETPLIRDDLTGLPFDIN